LTTVPAAIPGRGAAHSLLVSTACWLLAGATASLIPVWTFAQRSTPQVQSFDLQVPWTPLPATVAGKRQLVYELHLTNFARSELAIRRIQVRDTGSGYIVGDFREAELRSLIGRVDRTSGLTDKLAIPPGVRALVYLSVPAEYPGGTVRGLTHRVEYEIRADAPQQAVVEGGAFTVRNEPRISLGPPLRGGPWVAVYDSSWERGHRRVVFAVQGSAHIPGRFAIDWIRVKPNGKYFDGDGSNVTDWYGYGADVLAVADGIVADSRDGVPEGSVVTESAVATLPEEASGNYIAINLGGGDYAFYEHLKPGSVQVKPGEHVTRGQAIGRLGFTGQSTGPHLHFHVSDNNSPLNAEGVPYGLRAFKLLGGYPSTEAFGRSRPWTRLAGHAQAERREELPAPFDVVEFTAE
jgi:murein DD-endopeptidase